MTDHPRRPNPAPSPRRSLNLLVALLLLLSLAEMLAVFRGGAVHGNDFKHLWAGARMLALGANPYDPQELMRFAMLQGWSSINPFVYLPTTGLLLRPLAALPYPRALAGWFWLNWAAAWLLVLAGPGLLRVGRPALARLVGAVFLAAAFPFLRQQTAGQMNVMTAWLILGALFALRRRRDGLTGVLLAVGFAWKLAPALLILALWPLRRSRALWVGVALSAALWGGSLLLTGSAVQRDALRTLSQMGYGHSTWSEFGNDFHRDPFNQSPNSLLHHLLTANPHTRPWLALSPTVANSLTIVVSLALIALWLARRRRLLASPSGESSLFLAASLAMLLLPSLLWDHYVVQALPVLLWLAGDPRTSRNWPRALALLAIVALLCWPWPHAAPINQHGPGILLMSLRLWPILALYFWLLLDRPAPLLQTGGLSTASPGVSVAADYWDGILDPQNLERAGPTHGTLALADELLFADTPDLRIAADWLEAGRPASPAADWTLDLGAGLGANAFVLAGRGHHILAVDTSLARLRLLRRRAVALGLGPDRVALVVAAAEALPFRDAALARAYTKSVLIHADLPRAADELARALAPGGRAAFVEPQPGNPFAWLYRRLLAPPAWAAITRYFDASTQRLVLRRFGDPDPATAVAPCYLFSFLAFFFQFAWPRPAWFARCLRPLLRFDSWLFHHWPSLRPFAWFGVLRVVKCSPQSLPDPPSHLPSPSSKL